MTVEEVIKEKDKTIAILEKENLHLRMESALKGRTIDMQYIEMSKLRDSLKRLRRFEIVGVSEPKDTKVN